ncbi:hypothetical protein KI387_020187, partial [Taxus chinensis]
MGLPQDEPPPFPQYRRDDVEPPLPAPQPWDPDWVAEEPAGGGCDDARVHGSIQGMVGRADRAARIVPPTQPDLAAVTAEERSAPGQ